MKKRAINGYLLAVVVQRIEQVNQPFKAAAVTESQPVLIEVYKVFEVFRAFIPMICCIFGQ